ncbi:MAG: DNA topoisomerase IV [Candidatus Marinimicrobia bacterium]|nr:DNA topoisomerase IV [Candidatus Neomarinimicrobiota bacterium]|tara:strand:+ start:1529 stop:3367 length:1839 start_codon:yes stop_codon:yes gene_type:complete
MSKYDESSIKSLNWREHIRLRPGMYIGKLGNGKNPDDGIYVLIKEIIDNSIDEYVMGFGNKIEIVINENSVSVRDYGRGIPLGKVIECVSKINTGGKYDSKAFKKSVGLNGVGTKAVNALSDMFSVSSFRDGECKKANFSKGNINKDFPVSKTDEDNGTLIEFTPDGEIFKNFNYIPDHLGDKIWNYAYLNSGLTLKFNKKNYYSKKGLLDLLNKHIDVEKVKYPIVHIKKGDLEVAFTHVSQYGEEYYSFVNGQHTTQGGTHLTAFKESIVKSVRDFYKKDFDPLDIRSAIVAAISVKIQEPVFESQTKTKLGSTEMSPNGETIRSKFIELFKTEFDNYLHRNKDMANALLERILQSEKERKDMAGIRKLANKRAKKANLFNKKLRDCKNHLNDKNKHLDLISKSTLFITEGDSASGSITKSRDVDFQAVFSLRGKPLNCYGLSKKIVYENEEFNLLQHALNIEDGIEGLRYNNIVIATDADVDGMHIRLLLMTFFLQFFPDIVRNRHLYILETPLFRIRNKKETIYCYSEDEKQNALNLLGQNSEITRFKGLGEISPDEFTQFIGNDILLEPVVIQSDSNIDKTLSYYMGRNTPDRQSFIIENLYVEESV